MFLNVRLVGMETLSDGASNAAADVILAQAQEIHVLIAKRTQLLTLLKDFASQIQYDNQLQFSMMITNPLTFYMKEPVSFRPIHLHSM